MGAILALLIPLIPGLIQGIEKIFVKPAPIPGAPVPPAAPVPTGTDKMDAIVQSLRAIFEKLLATGIVPPGTAVTDDALRGAIEAEFQRLKGTGQLTQAPALGALYLVQGNVTPIKLG
jgi:hypothetical protein